MMNDELKHYELNYSINSEKVVKSDFLKFLPKNLFLNF